MKKKKASPKLPVNKIVSQYAMPDGALHFKLITVYADFSISIGAPQRTENVAPLRLWVRG